ncbi:MULTISPECIES: SPOR domain-containing protein [Methylobacterium]|uniref:SPOR domain-containing protein n=1 Tax=Methylobacterium TaxID=407 RepID=UPI0013EA127E|nr:SPOR domain-containing protein [Methylobacterium sp. DB0501]NGM35395.1 SPOR domain-containing protein [Methylobacterium sp. DB0501]
MTTNASRVPVDYDAYEQDRQPTPVRQDQARHDQARPLAPRPDPLAELARIVGQDDPFRALLEAKEAKEASRAAEPPRGGRVEPVMPSYGDAQAAHSGLSAGLSADFSASRQEPTMGVPNQPPSHTPESAFNQYLAAVERETVSEPAGAAPDAEPAPMAEPRPRGRRRIALVGTALGIVAASIGGALTWKAFHHGRSGAPILVMADQAPLKVAPQNAGGVEIPDQNKQIYERGTIAKDGQIRIVNREEQPLDVKQAARSLAAEAGSSASPAVPGNALTESLGEPRKVRTVSVRPEPSPAEAQRAAQAATQAAAQQQAAQQAPASPIPTMTLPTEATGSTPAPVTPRGPRVVPTAPAPQQAASPAAETPAPVAETPRQKPVQRVASAEPPVTTQAVPTPQAPVGGFSVQLSVRATEKEAEVAFRQAQERYGAILGGQSPLIRQAEVNGKSIYRVRVGPMSKEGADGLCGKLKASGAACFVAKN